MNSASPTADVGRKCSSDTGCCADPQPFDLSLETVRLDVPDGTGVRTIFSCFDFKLPQGAMLGIRGPSGAGKTSFLKSCKSSKDHSKPRNEVDTSLKSPV